MFSYRFTRTFWLVVIFAICIAAFSSPLKAETVHKNISIYVGKTKSIKLPAKSDKINCTSNKKSIAECKLNSNNLIIVPKKAGECTITLTVEKDITKYHVFVYPSARQYSFLKKMFSGKKVSIIGDSISTLKGYSTGHYRYSPQKTSDTYIFYLPYRASYWGNLIERFDMELGVNQSFRSTCISKYRYFYALSSYKRIDTLDDNGTPDIIIFFGGINDISQHVAPGKISLTAKYMKKTDKTTTRFPNYVTAYATALRRIHDKYPKAEIIALFPYGSKASKYNKLSAAICKFLGIKFVDLKNAGITNVDMYDSKHPNIKGHAKIVKCIMDTLYKNYH